MPMSDGAKRDEDRDGDAPKRTGDGKSANSAPDAVKDPNEKTDGKPGHPGQGDEVDPGGG